MGHRVTFPTKTDLAFYQDQMTPGWGRRFRSAGSLIDQCVNDHAQVRWTHGELAAFNLMQLVRGAVRLGKNPLEYLEQLAHNPACSTSPRRRAAFARKWVRRSNGERT